MILLVGPALAAGFAAHLESPGAGSAVIEVFQDDEDGFPREIAPDRLRISGGALASVDLRGFERRTAFAESGLRLWTAGWEAGAALPVRLTVWELPVEIGLRRLRGEAEWDVRPYTQGGVGCHALWLSSEQWDDYLVPALAGHWAAGVLVGEQERPFSLQLRLSLRPRFDDPGGSVETSQGTLSWSWSPGETSLSLLAGMRWP